MGSSVVGHRCAKLGCGAAALLWVGSVSAQVPAVPAPSAPPAAPVPPPASEPPAAVPAPTSPPPAPQVAPAPAVAPAPKRAEPPPPLDPPPSHEPPSRPSFLKTRDEMEQLQPARGRRRRLDDEAPRPEQPAPKPGEVPKDFVLAQSPWIDFSLTSFWMDERTDNFLNVGVQVGGYFVERIRLVARLVAPVNEATDSFSDYDSQFSSNAQYVDSRSVAVLYGATFGLILSNSKSFLFAPGLSVWRTDVSDYGTTAAFSLPFEWTTHRRLRVGFELALGHSFGGEAHRACSGVVTTSSPCHASSSEREGGTAVLFQYHMGWALSGL